MKNRIVKHLRPKIGARLTEDGRRIVFCHVPKCGGTSIVRSLSHQMYSFWERAVLPSFTVDLRASDRSSRALRKPKRELKEGVLAYMLSGADHRMVAGHVACRPALVEGYSKEWQFLTVLRDPVHRWISEYVYNTLKSSELGKNHLTIERYMGSEKGQATGVTFLRYFSNMPDEDIANSMNYVEEAVENLSRFAIVGILENLDSFSREIHVKCGKPIRFPVLNVSPGSSMKEELMGNDVLMDRIRHICEGDSLVYQRMRQRILSRP